MATCLKNKMSFDVAADNSSLDSLSFAGFVSVQDQQPKSPPKQSHQVCKQEPDFEFAQPRLGSTAPADLLISNGKLQPQAILFQSKQHPVNKEPCHGGLKPATSPRGKKSCAKRVSFEEDQEQKKKENNSPRPSARWKLFKSFVSPCRECKAKTPTVVSHTIVGGGMKIHY